MKTYRIIHEAPAAPGISQMEVATVEADSEINALLTWQPTAKRTSVREDGKPCLNYGFGSTILRQYTAVA